MKPITAYYLMLLYLIVMIRPLVPLISDGLSHTFAGVDHIATVHAKYGENHLQKELAATVPTDDNKNHGTTVKVEDQLPVHIQAEEHLFAFHARYLATCYPFFTIDGLPYVIIGLAVPPPKFC